MLSFFPQDALDEIWDLIESVSEGFPTYSCLQVFHRGNLPCIKEMFSSFSLNGVPLLSLFLLYRNIKVGKKRCLRLDEPVTNCIGNSWSSGCRR